MASRECGARGFESRSGGKINGPACYNLQTLLIHLWLSKDIAGQFLTWSKFCLIPKKCKQ